MSDARTDLPTILEAMQAVAANAIYNGSAVGLGHSVIGWEEPTKANAQRPLVTIWPETDTGERGDEVDNRTAMIHVSVVVKYDTSDTTLSGAELIQSLHAMFAVRDALYIAKEDPDAHGLSGVYLAEHDTGIQVQGFADRDRLTSVGQFWKAIYKRTIPTP